MELNVNRKVKSKLLLILKQMFGKKSKTLFDYVAEHSPYHDIENPIKPKYLENTATSEHKELESEVEEYWDLIHPLLCDYINSYGILVKKINSEVEQSRDNIENARRQLTFEQQNVQEQADKMRDLKGELQNVLVIKRDLESRLEDERAMMEAQFKVENRALELIAGSKFDNTELEKIISEVKSGMGESADTQRLQTKVDALEVQIKTEREENEKIQGELSTSFMEKIQRSDEIIKNLKSRLGDE